VSERREVGMEEYRDVEIEGLHFLESMGFMLDNLNFRNLAPAQQVETLKRVPLFQVPKPAATAVSEASEARNSERIARLLASV